MAIVQARFPDGIPEVISGHRLALYFSHYRDYFLGLYECDRHSQPW